MFSHFIKKGMSPFCSEYIEASYYNCHCYVILQIPLIVPSYVFFVITLGDLTHLKPLPRIVHHSEPGLSQRGGREWGI